MDIASFKYLIFLGIILSIYYVIPLKYQWICLLLGSLCYYYMAAVPYTFIYIAITTTVTYYASFYMDSRPKDKYKKIILFLSIVVNISLLAVLKYTNLAINTWNQIGKILNSNSSVNNVTFISSLAISFYTLQMVAYIVDVYWEKIVPTKNPLKLLLFCIYFPQMISGPISRYDELSEGLFGGRDFKYDNIAEGLIRIAYGMIKKLAISNRIAIVANEMWSNTSVYQGQYIWIAAFIYIFQLYTDFSGCMDIVCGTSMCFGINLVENFRAPFFSKNIQEFWRRWHITLGTWLRDYILVPLQRSKFMKGLGKNATKRIGKKWGRKIPVFLSMLALWLAMGLWHGNSWKYIIGEGLWFWLVIVIRQLIDEPCNNLKTFLHISGEEKMYKLFQVIRTLAIYSFGMLFFRADTMLDAISRIISGVRFDTDVSKFSSLIIFSYSRIGVIGGIAFLVSFVGMIIVDRYIYKDEDILRIIRSKPIFYRWGIYLMMILLICLSANVAHQDFAYAQF